MKPNFKLIASTWINENLSMRVDALSKLIEEQWEAGRRSRQYIVDAAKLDERGEWCLYAEAIDHPDGPCGLCWEIRADLRAEEPEPCPSAAAGVG